MIINNGDELRDDGFVTFHTALKGFDEYFVERLNDFRLKMKN